MLTKSNASMYILTLILSFVLSGYILNLMKIKLKMYIKNGRNSNKFKAFGSYQTLYFNESLVLRNRLLFIYSYR